jgi:hypothetical protein
MIIVSNHPSDSTVWVGRCTEAASGVRPELDEFTHLHERLGQNNEVGKVLANDSRIRGRSGWFDDVNAGSGSRDISIVQHDVRMRETRTDPRKNIENVAPIDNGWASTLKSLTISCLSVTF